MPKPEWLKKYNTPGKRRALKGFATKIQAKFRAHRSNKGPLKQYKLPLPFLSASSMKHAKTYPVPKGFKRYYRNSDMPYFVKEARKRGRENYWKYHHASKKYGRTAALFLPKLAGVPHATEAIYNYI